jgi:hypothetical protein
MVLRGQAPVRDSNITSDLLPASKPANSEAQGARGTSRSGARGKDLLPASASPICTRSFRNGNGNGKPERANVNSRSLVGDLKDASARR